MLYQTVAERWPAFREQMEEAGGLPKFVVHELEELAEMAVHLEERVLPAVPVRHWICSLPWGLRALCGYDRELCSQVVSAFVQELARSLKSRAKQELDLASVKAAHTGAVCALQRTDAALRLNVHLHVLALDGVYVRDAERGTLGFEALDAPASRDQRARQTVRRRA